MALALSVQHLRHYLLGRSFKVYTDHSSLRHLLQQRLTTTDQQCWLVKLMGFQFEVVYKSLGRKTRPLMLFLVKWVQES